MDQSLKQQQEWTTDYVVKKFCVSRASACAIADARNAAVAAGRERFTHSIGGLEDLRQQLYAGREKHAANAAELIGEKVALTQQLAAEREANESELADFRWSLESTKAERDYFKKALAAEREKVKLASQNTGELWCDLKDTQKQLLAAQQKIKEYESNKS